MIQCYYTRKTLDTVAKAGRRRAVGCGGVLFGFLALVLIGITLQDPVIWFQPLEFVLVMAGFAFLIGITYLFHWLLRNVEKTTLDHAGDEITLDDDEIRLLRADGTQITLPRKGLKIRVPYYASGSMIFKIKNSQLASSSEIVLTSVMENTRELVETIQPGSWDTGE